MKSWIPEQSAAEMLKRQPRTLRKLVKGGKMNISYTNINGRTYFYSEKDIAKYLDSRAIKVNIP